MGNPFPTRRGEHTGDLYDNLCKLLSQARPLKEDFKALQRDDISLDEWKERQETAFAQFSDKVIISIVTTTSTGNDCGIICGAVVPEMIASSRLNNKTYINPYSDTFHIWMVSSRKARMAKGADGCIKLDCDLNVMRFKFSR